MRTIRFYSKPGCSLCDKAKAALLRARVRFDEVDISSDPALKQEYGWFIPVVEVDGEWLFQAGMDPEELSELLRP